MIKCSTFITVTLAAALGVGLFVVKYQVQDLEDQLAMIDHEIVSERQSIHVLNAEWSHLNEPGRLKVLAERHLSMVPLNYQQYTAVDRVALKLGDIRDIKSSEDDQVTFADRMKNALNEGLEQ